MFRFLVYFLEPMVFLGSVEEMDLPIWEKVLANWQQRIDATELEPGGGFAKLWAVIEQIYQIYT